MLPVISENAPVISGARFTHEGTEYAVENNKLIKLGTHEVAVVYSPGYGGGWSTWNSHIDPTDARIATASPRHSTSTRSFPQSTCSSLRA